VQIKFKRYLACARNKLWWMTPEWGSSLHRLPPETQFLLLQLEDDGSSSSKQRYALLLPLIDGDFRGTLRPNRWVLRSCLCILVCGGDGDVCALGLLL
jgi:raffinose synthase